MAGKPAGQWYEIIGKGRFGPIEEGGSALNDRTRRLDFVCIVDDSSDNCVCARARVLCLGERHGESSILEQGTQWGQIVLV